MNENAVRSKDHVELTFIFAKLQENGYLTSEDLQTLREIASRIDEPRLEWLAESVRYIGEGKYIPAESTSFVTELDKIRYEIHRIVENRSKISENDLEELSDDEILTAIPDVILESYTLRASEVSIDGGVERTISGYLGEDEFDLVVKDDYDRQKREVKIDYNAQVRVEAHEYLDELAYEEMEKDQLRYPHVYAILHTTCQSYLVETLEGKTERIYRCETDLAPMLESEDVKDKQKFIEEIKDTLRDYIGCHFFTRKGNELISHCEDDIMTSEAYYNVFDDYVDYVRDYMVDWEEAMEDYKREVNEVGAASPIPFKCETVYGYPHMGGIYFYAKCSGEKEYDLDLMSVAKSLEDIHKTLGMMYEYVGGDYYWKSTW